MINFLVADIATALDHQGYLGFGNLSQEKFEFIVSKAKKDYSPFPIAVLNRYLTWPEFIIITAYRLVLVSTDTKILERTMSLRQIVAFSEVQRLDFNFNEYLTWNGWVEII